MVLLDVAPQVFLIESQAEEQLRTREKLKTKELEIYRHIYAPLLPHSLWY